ncbi:MAG TPA: D-alanine--D-alanine ligase [Candidatus Kapabacteria bacterium]|nr:D-alanine--D-alanine ligase [Candidatus Kapabacteria bacterium]
MNVAVICGGLSTERNVSITGGKSVQSALLELGHNAILVDPAYGANGTDSPDFNSIDMSIAPTLEDLKKFSTKSYLECIDSSIFDNIDVAFIVLHGNYGEDGLIQSLLEFRGIPYTGSGVSASALAFDKVKTKLICSAIGVLTPNWTVVQKKDIQIEGLGKDIKEAIGKELVIKPNSQGSTIGLTIIKNGNIFDIEDAIKLAAEYSDTVLIEEYIAGKELTVGIIGEEVLPVIEIVTEDGFYDYNHKYTKGKTNYICPAEISPDIAEFTQNMAMTLYKSLGCKGFARVDFRLDDEGQPFCLELNSIPGFTSQSLVPMAAKVIDLDFPEICSILIDIALESKA